MGRLARIDWVAVAIGLTTLAAVTFAFAIAPGPQVEEVEEAVFDQYQRWKPRPYRLPDPENPGQLLPAPPVLVIDIDEASLAEMGQWPWPRYYMAEMVWRLTEAGAATVAFDVFFSEPDRTSPAEQARAYARFGELYAAAVEAFEGLNAATPIDHDAIFADAIARNRVVLGTVGTDTPQTDRLPPRPEGAGIPIIGPPPDITTLLRHFEGVTPNLPLLANGASGIGAISLAKDAGTMVREVPMVIALADDEDPYPTLAIEALRVAQGASSHVLKTSVGSGQTDFGDTPVAVSMQVGGAVVPLSPDGSLRVRYSAAIGERVISARDVLRPEGLAPGIAERVAGKVVFVGSSAPALFDIRRTPLHPRISGVHIHAEIVEQIFAQDFLSRPDLAEGVERVVMVAGGLIVVLLIGYNLPVLAFAMLVGLLAAILGGSWYAFSAQSVLLSPVAPALGVALPHFIVSGYKYFRSERGRREVTRQFEHFVSPEVIEDIIGDPERFLTPGGAQRELTILFLDVRRFSTITETMAPQEVITFINKLLTPLTDVIIENEGTIDKYMGDAVMAFWNAPRETEAHEVKAVRTVLAFTPVMAALNAEFKAAGMEEISIGVGINTGECSVGNMGSLKRLAYSCVGDAVNLASRIEGQTKAYGVGNLIGSKTAAGAPGFAMVEVDSVAVKGRAQPETIYTVAGDSDVANDPAFQMLQLQLTGARAAYLAQNWDAAETAYRQAGAALPAGIFDPAALSEVMLARIAEHRENPPPQGWDGIYVAKSK
ncbi:MAG: adenylate/guanylate cyclase domain-containing protein [Pseudomonadota bacterium]